MAASNCRQCRFRDYGRCRAYIGIRIISDDELQREIMSIWIDHADRFS